MKKRYIVLLTVILVCATLALAACNGTEQLTSMEILRQRYGEIGSAKSIEQKITVQSGNFTQFESVKTYLKTQNGYDVTGTEKRLNDATASEAYAVKTVSEQVSAAEGAAPTLKLDENYFETGFRLTETGLTASVKADNVKDVFALDDGELKAPVSNLTLELNTSKDKLTTVKIKFVSGGSNVTVELTMTY